MKRHTSAPLGALLFLSCVCLIATHATIVRSMNMQGPPRPGAPGSGVPDEDGVIIPTFEEEEALDEQDIEFDNFETPEKRVCGLAYYKEKACADHAEQWENEFDAAKDWITVGGGYVHHALRVGWNPFSGRGLYTTYNLLNATTLFRIPTQFTFHNKTAYENEGVLELLRAARKDKVLFNSHTIFAVALLHEKTKGANSQWAPLIASLPSVEQLRHLPFYWPRDELNSLKGTFFQKVVTNQMATVVNAYQAVTKTAPKLMQNLGQQDDFQWAYLVSSTYQRWANFTHQVQHYSGFGAHAGLQPGFIPLVDLVNHPTYDAIRADRAELHNKNIETKQRAAGVGPHPMRYPIAVTDTVIEEGIPRQIKMYLVAPAKPGDQVFMYYGDMDDSHSLSTFGFVNHERDADTMTTALATNLTILFENSNNLTGRAWAPLDLPKSAPGYKEKVAFLKGKTVQSCILHVHDLGASACLSFLRLAVAPLSYTQKLGEFNFGVTSQGFIDLENEVAVWRAVGAVVSNVTRDYMKIKVRKAEGAKPEKVTAMEAMELGGLKAIATDKYSKRIQLALRPILQELRTLKWFMQLGRAVSLPEGTTSATTPAEASLQFSEMIEKFDDVYYETHHSKLHFMREFLDALYKRRGTYDPLADVEADATVTATTKKAEPQDKIEL